MTDLPHDPRIEAVAQIIGDAERRGRGALVVTDRRSEVDYLVAALDARGITAQPVTGTTRPTEREASFDRVNSGGLVVATNAVLQGIELSTNVVNIWYSPPRNPERALTLIRVRPSGPPADVVLLEGEPASVPADIEIGWLVRLLSGESQLPLDG